MGGERVQQNFGCTKVPPLGMGTWLTLRKHAFPNIGRVESGCCLSKAKRCECMYR